MRAETVFESLSPGDTARIGEEIARNAKARDVFCLSGELGAGKTVFASGFAQGLGIGEDILSPTFTLLNEYRGGRLPLYHFDLYRLDAPAELCGIGYEEYFFGDGVCLVEWPCRAGGLIPENAFFALFETDFGKGPMYRRITVT